MNGRAKLGRTKIGRANFFTAETDRAHSFLNTESTEHTEFFCKGFRSPGEARRGLGIEAEPDINTSIEQAIGKIKRFEEVNAKINTF